ncbi:MAG TPA: hypothetical protein VFV07_07150, partial [Rhizomicrobium sp.]|nr:hypothetical protein [Rhizomicrobium sp.]
MARWKRRLITEAVIGLLLLYMYVQLERLGWSRHAILIALGGFAVACGLISFAAKPNEKFAEMTGQYEGRTLV